MHPSIHLYFHPFIWHYSRLRALGKTFFLYSFLENKEIKTSPVFFCIKSLGEVAWHAFPHSSLLRFDPARSCRQSSQLERTVSCFFATLDTLHQLSMWKPNGMYYLFFLLHEKRHHATPSYILLSRRLQCPFFFPFLSFLSFLLTHGRLHVSRVKLWQHSDSTFHFFKVIHITLIIKSNLWCCSRLIGCRSLSSAVLLFSEKYSA